MTEVRRPAPAETVRARCRRVLERFVEERRSRHTQLRAVAADRRNEAQLATAGSSGARLSGYVWGGVIAVGAALLMVGIAMAASRWTERSADPIDGQLPFLLGADDATDSGEPTPSVGTELSETGANAHTPGASEASGASQATPEEVSGLTPASSANVGIVGSSQVESDPAERIVVHVSGAVADPGVVELDAAIGVVRVHHAVALAGGTSPDADLDRINLAAALVDGERIHVPTIGEELPQVVTPSRLESSTGEGGTETPAPLVDVNRATQIELESLPGVGPTIARAIVDLRSARGPYADLDELLLVDGIGPSKLEALRPYAVVGG